MAVLSHLATVAAPVVTAILINNLQHRRKVTPRETLVVKVVQGTIQLQGVNGESD